MYIRPDRRNVFIAASVFLGLGYAGFLYHANTYTMVIAYSALAFWTWAMLRATKPNIYYRWAVHINDEIIHVYARDPQQAHAQARLVLLQRGRHA